MGIYPNHSLEYWIELDSTFDNMTLKTFIEALKSETDLNIYVTKKNNICVLSAARIDKRLVESKYYNDRKQDWFSLRTFNENWREPIKDQSLVDIEITNSELNVIARIKEQFNGLITYEGWFDVNTIGYSY